MLTVKFYAPAPTRALVPRSRLEERLDAVPEAKLTLVSAPAGFGKTTLLAAWLARVSEGMQCAWLSLDTGDNDPVSFWTSVIAALETVAPGVGTRPLAILGSPQPINVALTALLNELHATGYRIVLVLDDYHVLDAPEIHEGMAVLLERLPPQAHVIIATRADPPLPLARMRARAQLIEIRAADLRFSTDEAREYLNGRVGLGLEQADVEMLAERTEGWAAALQLAGLSMQGRDNPKSFIAGFAGDDRYVIDYLVEEVLQRQSAQIRDFLLATSILARLCGPLCDAVTGQDGGRATLQALERANLFLVPLDDRREWYRYHHLFADVLRTHIKAERPEQVAELHRRASAWYESHGHDTDAIDHAMAGEDYGRAAELVELAMPTMHRSRQEGPLRRMLEALPSAVIRDRPVLTVGYAGTLMQMGQFEGVDELLDTAERLIGDERRSGGVMVADETELRHLPGTIAMYRTALALARGDVAATIGNAARALELIEEGDHFRRGALLSLRGLAHWTAGDLAEAYRWYSDGMTSLERAGYRADVVGGAVTLADLRIAQGRLGDATQHYEHGLALATAGGGSPLRGAADMHAGLAALAYERNDFDAVQHHLHQVAELGEENGLPKNPWRWRVTAAWLRLAEGHVHEALDIVDQAERVYDTDFSPDVRPIGAVRARMWISAGRLHEARGWASTRGLSPEDEPAYLREYEHATLARLLVAEGRRDHDDRRVREAIELTDRLAEAAHAGGRRGSAIDVLVVGALARHASDDAAGALETLSRAIAVAEPEGYVRVFLDEGSAMTSLLTHAAKVAGTTPYIVRLLAAGAVDGKRLAAPGGLVEPLSDRELEVLRLLSTDLSGPDIAGELVVSLNTVRTHTKNLYAKLGVNSRIAAVRRAAELDLLARAGRRRHE